MMHFQIHEDFNHAEAIHREIALKKPILESYCPQENQEKMAIKKFVPNEKLQKQIHQKKSFLDNNYCQGTLSQKCPEIFDCISSEKKEEKLNGSAIIEVPFLNAEKENQVVNIESDKEGFPTSLLHNFEYREVGNKMGISILLGCSVIFLVNVQGSNGVNNFSDEDYKRCFPHKEDEGTLKLVNVMFRHGNRTTCGGEESYPNDPYLNMTYFPYGLGQLTNAGKIKEYYVGTELRNRYDDFLGKYYYPDLVNALSTNYDRTKMSLLLVLAGLFPPRQEDAVLGKYWQPIPYDYSPGEHDRVLHGTLCPKFIQQYMEYTQLPSVQEKFKKHEKLFNYLSEHTGLNVTTVQQVYNLQFGLTTEKEFGLELPTWTKSVFPEPIMSVSYEEYFVTMGTPELRTMAIGFFLEKLLNDVQTNINDRRKLKTKIHLYSAHENTVAQLLIALGVFEKHVPNYGSYVILELHKIEGVYGIKVYYQGWDGRGLRLMRLPECEEFCPLDIFAALVQEYIPVDGDSVCGD